MIMEASRASVLADSPAPPRVLVVEHPMALAATLAAALKATGMAVEIAASQAEAVEVLEQFDADVLLLHAEGAVSAGLDKLPLFARNGACGVIVTLDSDGEAARINSLDRGADDVVSVRAPLGEVAARIRALHRRLVRTQPALAHEPPGAIMLDPAHRFVIGPRGERTPLSEAEFVALETLLDADGAPVSRDWLGRVALKRPVHSEDRSVDQLVLKLRRKLTAVGVPERTILSARRQGYVITDPSRFRSFGMVSPDVDLRRPLVRVAG